MLFAERSEKQIPTDAKSVGSPDITYYLVEKEIRVAKLKHRPSYMPKLVMKQEKYYKNNADIFMPA